LFDEVLSREFGDYRYAREHRLTVDAYSLQHPAEYMRSPKSNAAHLTGMYAAFAGGGTAQVNREGIYLDCDCRTTQLMRHALDSSAPSNSP
jgi:hypothetical protein